MYYLIIFFISICCSTTSLAYDIEADSIEWNQDKQFIVAKGNVKVNINQYKLNSDDFIYNVQGKKIYLNKNIIINDSTLDSQYKAEHAFIDIENHEIKIIDLYGQIRNANIAAKSIKYNQKLYEGEFITTTLCNICENGKKITPFWKIQAKKLITDIKLNEEIKLRDVYLYTFGKRIAYIPFLSLPTPTTKGKTGFLMPNIQNKGLGYQLDVPFYFKANKNLDFTLYPALGKRSIYGLNFRYKVENGGYESTIYTASLPFTKGNHTTNTSIFRAWPANIRINSNLFFQPENASKQSEIGITGELALGIQPILLYKYDISDRKILAGRVYANTTYNSTLATVNAINLHNLRLNTRTISIPKINFYDITKIDLRNNPFSSKPLLITHISTNSIYDETFSNRLFDTVGEIKLLATYNLNSHNKITYSTQLIGYKSTHNIPLYNHRDQAVVTTLDIHWQSKLQHNRKLIEPHIALHLQDNQESFFTIDQGQINNQDETLSIYSTTNNINPNNIFASGLYTTSSRSIMQKNGNHIDYGFIFSTYNKDKSTLNKLFLILGGRQYLSQQSRFGKIKTGNQDLSLAGLQDLFKEKYISQLTVEKETFTISNRTWLTEKFNLLTNEFYLNKKFNNLSTGIQYLFLNSKYNFNEQIKQSKFERYLKLKLKYNLTENWSTGIKNTIKFGQDKQGNNITKISCIKGKIQYENECIQIGLTIKKELNGGRKNLNDSVSSYNLYVKIPSI